MKNIEEAEAEQAENELVDNDTTVAGNLVSSSSDVFQLAYPKCL